MNTTLDTLTSITDPRGQTVNYTYDQNRKVTKTAATVSGKEYANSYTYTKDKLTQVKHNTSADTSGDVAYNFEYDALGRPTVVKVGTQALSTTQYNADGTVASVTYGNGGKAVNTYDAYKRLTGVKFDSETSNHFSYVYGANGSVAQLKDHVRGTTVTSEYDAANRPQRKTILEGSTHAYTGEVSYDGYNNLQTFKEQVGSGRTAYTTTFTHDNENRPTLLNFGGTRQVAYAYDGLGRVSQRTVNAGGTGVATTYGYLAGGHGTGSTTPLVQTITQSGTTLTYAYDDAGNITSVSDGSKTTSYEYDLLGQLTRVNDPYDTTAGSIGTTWKYAYDQGGNIQSKTAYAFTTGTVGSSVKTDSFTYGDTNWKDKLTAFNGASISYDAIGNPTSDGTWSYIWEKGRQLQQISKVGEVVRFVYNEDGLRVQKVAVTTGTTNYTLHGKNIVHMTQGSNSLHFFYDAQNKPAVVLFNGTAYAYLYNLQGDVIALVDTTGTQVVKYTYDAWGKPISRAGTLASTLGTIQPFRYRGYVFDEETGLYYLRSRYYNPNWCRFVNADKILGQHGRQAAYNVFSYCSNAPVCLADPSGKAAILNWIKSLVKDCLSANIEEKKTEYKLNISLASNIGLSFKDYPIANELFHHFLWGNGEGLSSAVENELSRALSTSGSLRKQIEKDYNGGSNLIFSSVTFSSGDLHYAIGKASYTAEVMERNGKLVAIGMLSDTYDFTEIRTHDSGFSWLSVEANNLGYQLQHDGYGTEYSYSVPFEIEIFP